MPKLLLTLLAALIVAVPGVRAEQDQQEKEEEHAGHHQSDAQSPGTGDHSPVEHLRANMKAMQDIMARIRDTADPAEKRRLLRVHMLAMQEQIRTMRSATPAAHDHGGDGGAKESGAAGKGGDAMKDAGMMGGMMKGGMMKMHKKVEGRLDALEGLLEQLIEHEAAEDALGSQ